MPTAVHSWGESDPLESVSNLTWVKCSLQQERWDWNRKTVSNLRNISKLGFFSLSDSCEEKYWKFFFAPTSTLPFDLPSCFSAWRGRGILQNQLFRSHQRLPRGTAFAPVCTRKIVKRFSQRWTILIKAQLSLTRGIKFLYALASLDSKLH